MHGVEARGGMTEQMTRAIRFEIRMDDDGRQGSEQKITQRE